jgi:hypothetical protein
MPSGIVWRHPSALGGRAVRFFDRFTRDELSAKVWWPMALLGLVALVASVPLANRAADQARADAAARATAVSIATLEPLLSAGAVAELPATARSIVAADPTVDTVRIWNAAHQLMVSSVAADHIRSGEALNDAELNRAMTDGADWVVTNRTMSGGEGPVTFNAYTLIESADGKVVTQFEAADAKVLSNVHRFWMWVRIAVGLGTLFVFALALLSMREPLARIGAGVPFYAESVPPGLRVIDAESAITLEQAGGRAKDRLASLQAKLDESERLRLRTEGELQQALTALRTGGQMAAPAEVPDAAPEPIRASRPSPEVAAAALEAAEQNKRARAAAAAEKQRAKAAAAAPAPPAIPVESSQTARPDEVTVTADDLRITTSVAPETEAEAEEDRGPEVVVPQREPAAVGTGSASSGPDADHAARDVLERLVAEPTEHQPADDTSDLRSRLARTAALKKPGSRERQESREDP